MKYIILCGGEGSRNKNYSLPKPLNYINGKHMIEYVINNIPSKDVYVIYNSNLDAYNFREIVSNKCKDKNIYFSKITYFTRGAVETAYIGVKSFDFYKEKIDENIIFIDNDNLHSFELDTINKYFENDFIGYSIDYKKTNYSFIKFQDNLITDIQEKNKISNYYCCGLYGFKNCEKFISIAKFIITNDIKDKNEFYFSKVYKSLLDKKEKINVFYIEKTEHIGSFDEIMFNSSLITSNKLRVCFDLDNTLVTYPQIPGDYTTVKPIEKNITTLRDLKNKGHTIIIYTARRMTTHGNNIGKVLKDIGMITFNTLDQFNIPYDEIIFGKPIADIYIDDRAINPYINNISYFGIFEDDNELILNKIPNNKYNIIRRYGNKICKLGPSKYIKGEYYFYTHIPTNLKHLFVDFYSMIEKNDCIEIEIKYIKSIPLFYLYKNELITYKIINHLFDILKELHSFKGNDILDIDYNNVSNNYFLKLKNRLNDVDYPFPDVNDVFNEIISGLKENYDPEIVNIIHGDYWFSNILLTYENEYKIIDMKGQVDGILTLNGDKYYDYGKFYQSIIGYDLVLNGFELNNEYINEMNTFFLDLCCKNGLNINYLKYVTKSLIFGTFHSISDENIENRNAIWNLLKSIK